LKPRIAISLGSSFLGYATHAGFMNRLHELGIRPVAVGGSSAGAVASGLYAAGLTPEEIKKVVFAHRFRRSFVRRTPWFTHYIKSTFNERYYGTFKPEGAVQYLESVLKDRQIESLNAPRYMAAVSDLETCRTLFLKSGPLARTMIASCCIPTVFSPLQINGKYYHDGGVAHEVPIDPWLEEDDIDLIVMHRVTHHETPPPRFFPANLLHYASKSHECAGEQLQEYRLRLAAMHGKKVLVATTTHERPVDFSGKRMPHFYAAGEAEAQRFYDAEISPLL
jgi:NTE family protein